MDLTLLALLGITLILTILAEYKDQQAEKELDKLFEELEKLFKSQQQEIKDLKKLRLEEIRKNTALERENAEQKELLNKIADKSVVYLVGREKETLDVIKELTRDYQSKS